MTSIQEDGCDKGAYQSYLGAEKNTLVNPIGFSLVNAAVVCAILESISGLEPSSVITDNTVIRNPHQLKKMTALKI